MAIIQLHDAWARFCREVVILSAGCRPVTATGLRLSRVPGVSSRRDVIPRLLSTYAKRNFEPRWGDSGQAIGAARRLAIQNAGTFTAALGAANSTAEEVRRVRNFFAHRSERAARSVRTHPNHGRNTSLDVLNLAGTVVPPGIRRIHSWINNLHAVAEAAIQ